MNQTGNLLPERINSISLIARMSSEIPGLRCLVNFVAGVTVYNDIDSKPALVRSRYIFVPILFSVLISAGVNLQLFQDGSSYLFELLVTQSAIRHQRVSALLIQAPSIMAGKLFSRLQIDPAVNLQILRLLFSLNYSFVPAAALGLCWLILRRKHQDLFVWAVLVILFINLVNFSWVSELLISVQLCFPLLLAAILVPGTRLYWFLTGALLPTVFFLHPLVLFSFLTMAMGCGYVGTMTTGKGKAASLSALLFLIAAIIRGVLNLNTLTPYESSFLEPVEMRLYFFSSSLESKVFLATSLATGLACLLAKSNLHLRRSLPVVFIFLISAQFLAVMLFVINFSFPPLLALSILIICLGLILGFYRRYHSQTTVDAKINLLYVVCMSSAVITSLLLISGYFAESGKFHLKTGLTLITSLLMMLMVSVDSRDKVSAFERAQRWRLAIVLCMAFAIVTTTKSLVWHSSVQKLEQTLSALRVPCAEIVAPEFVWLQSTPYSIINNWSLPTLALVVQDTPTRKLLLEAHDCASFYESGLVQIDPWTKIPKTRIIPPLN